MKSKLKTHFLSHSYLHDSYSHLQNLSQGTMSVKKYTGEVEKLLIRSNHGEVLRRTWS